MGCRSQRDRLGLRYLCVFLGFLAHFLETNSRSGKPTPEQLLIHKTFIE